MRRDDDPVADALGRIAMPPLPPIGDALASELERIAPVRTRRPWRDIAIVGGASIVYAGALLGVLALRRDLGQLPTPWMIAAAVAWAAGFVVPLWLAIVPRPGSVMPRWRLAGIAAMTCAVVFVTAGLVVHPHGADSAHLGWDKIHHGHTCMEIGLLTALVPVVLGAIVLRGTLPVGARWAAAGLGAAGGSLGGLVLHLHCPIADGLHIGLVHGGVVVVAALIAALLVPRTTGA
jgi:hypothetical protein